MGRIAKKISREALDTVMQKFNEMPQKAEATALPLNDAFLALKPAISEMQKKGYSLIEILQLLKESGVDAGMTTLKAVVSKPRKKQVSQPKPQVKPEQKPVQTIQQKYVPAIQDPDEK